MLVRKKQKRGKKKKRESRGREIYLILILILILNSHGGIQYTSSKSPPRALCEQILRIDPRTVQAARIPFRRKFLQHPLPILQGNFSHRSHRSHLLISSTSSTSPFFFSNSFFLFFFFFFFLFLSVPLLLFFLSFSFYRTRWMTK